jgi:hypothetical protein
MTDFICRLKGCTCVTFTSIEYILMCAKMSSTFAEHASAGCPCPYASRVHKYLGTDVCFCPMSQTVLTTLRKKYPRSVVTNTNLEQSGSFFTIRVQK